MRCAISRSRTIAPVPPRDGEFWAAVRANAPPARLANKLDLFAANGRINLLDQETFEEVDWAWLLIGSGCLPAAMELQTREQLAKLAPQEVAALRNQVQQVAGSMPRHIDFLRHQFHCGARAALTGLPCVTRSEKSSSSVAAPPDG